MSNLLGEGSAPEGVLLLNVLRQDKLRLEESVRAVTAELRAEAQARAAAESTISRLEERLAVLSASHAAALQAAETDRAKLSARVDELTSELAATGERHAVALASAVAAASSDRERCASLEATVAKQETLIDELRARIDREDAARDALVAELRAQTFHLSNALAHAHNQRDATTTAHVRAMAELLFETNHATAARLISTELAERRRIEAHESDARADLYAQKRTLFGAAAAETIVGLMSEHVGRVVRASMPVVSRGSDGAVHGGTLSHAVAARGLVGDADGLAVEADPSVRRAGVRQPRVARSSTLAADDDRTAAVDGVGGGEVGRTVDGGLIDAVFGVGDTALDLRRLQARERVVAEVLKSEYRSVMRTLTGDDAIPAGYMAAAAQLATQLRASREDGDDVRRGVHDRDADLSERDVRAHLSAMIGGPPMATTSISALSAGSGDAPRARRVDVRLPQDRKPTRGVPSSRMDGLPDDVVADMRRDLHGLKIAGSMLEGSGDGAARRAFDFSSAEWLAEWSDARRRKREGK